MKIHKIGCPICGERNEQQTVGAQACHLAVDHSWWQCYRLVWTYWWRTRMRWGLCDIVIARMAANQAVEDERPLGSI